MEVWIEIWREGIKVTLTMVTSYMEVWIEIKYSYRFVGSNYSHLLHGGVD